MAEGAIVTKLASLQRPVAPTGRATEAFTVRTLDDRAATAANASGVPGAGGALPRHGIATRSPPRLAQSAGVPGSFTNVPFMQSATALSDGGCAETGVTIFG